MAIALVALFHFAPTIGVVAASGWIGVDLFFVISGFLITGICLDHRGPGFFRAFYGRRALRILPPYFALLGVFAVVSLFALGRLPIGFGWMATFLTNLPMARAGDASVVPLAASHLWSVAVEEQFYLLWPFCVATMQPRRAVLVALAAIPTALILRLWLFHAGAGMGAHVLMPARMDGLAIGALMAFAARSGGAVRGRSLGRMLASVSPVLWLVGIYGCCVLVSASAWPNAATLLGAVTRATRYTCVAGFFAALVWAVVCAPPGNVLARALSVPSVEWLGRRSYGVYLIHFPVAVTIRAFGLTQSTVPRTVLFVAIATTASVGLAELSWRLIERPSLSRKVAFPYAAKSRLELNQFGVPS